MRSPLSRYSDASSFRPIANITPYAGNPRLNDHAIAAVAASIVPGYRGIQLVSNLQLINTMTMARQHASPELQGTFQQGTDEARVRVQRARELMASSAKGGADAPPAS